MHGIAKLCAPILGTSGQMKRHQTTRLPSSGAKAGTPAGCFFERSSLPARSLIGCVMAPSTIQFCLILLSYKSYLLSLVKLVLHAEVARLAEIHQFPDGTIVETLHTQTPLELLDRDLAGEAVIGAVEADQPGDDPLQKRHALGENGLQDGLLTLE